MNNKTRVAAGLSGTGVVVLIFHFFHLTQAVNDFDQQDKEEKMLKNAKVTIILTDSTGKKDTMPMEDYLKHNK